MAMFETWLDCDLQKPVEVKALKGNVFSADAQSNKISVRILDGGQAASVSGTVSGYVIRNDGATVIVDGTLTNNIASIVLPASAYTIVGTISICIRLISSNVKTVVGACTGYVYQTSTDTIVDPGHIIPSLDELLAKIAACEAATTAANAAATNANNKAAVADTAATNANNKAAVANAAAIKIDDMTADAESVSSSSSADATISEVSGHKHIHLSIPRGQDGRDGIIAQIDMGLFTMSINNDGDLICTYSTDPPALSINSNGDLIYTV